MMKNECQKIALLLILLFTVKQKASGQELPDISTTHRLHYALKDSTVILKAIQYAERITYTKPDSALAILRNTLYVSGKMGFVKGLKLSLWSAGRVFTILGEYDSSIISYRKTLPYLEESMDSVLVYHGIGRTLSLSARYHEAMNTYLKALEILKRNPNHLKPKIHNQNLILLYHDIATTLLHSNQFKKSNQYIDIALKISDTTDNIEYRSKLFNVKGSNYYYGFHLIDSALLFLDSAISLAKKENLQGSIHPVLVNKGTIYVKEKQFSRAIAAFQQAKLITEQYNIHLNDRIANISALGDAYLAAGNLKAAEQYLLEAWQYAPKLPRERLFISSRLAMLYERMGKFKEAYRYQMIYLDALGKTYNSEAIAKVNELETRFRTAEKDKEIAQNELLISNQRNKLTQNRLWIAIIAGAGGISILLFSWLYFYQRQKNKLLQSHQKIAALNAKMEGEEEERKRIAQELHDDINSQIAGAQSYLLTIGNLVPQVNTLEPYQEVSSILKKAATDIRNIAHNLLPPDINGAQLAEMMEALSIRFGATHNLKIEFNAYGTFKQLNNKTALNIYRIYQELLQNIAKHAKATVVVVLLSQFNNELNLTVEDNGIGIDNDGIKKGIGWINIENRVKLFNGRVSVESEKNSGTTVSISALIS